MPDESTNNYFIPGFEKVRLFVEHCGDVIDKICTKFRTTATHDESGLMSAEDKTKLDGIVTVTQSVDGLMTANDKKKLDGYPNVSKETWTFTMADGSTVTKTVLLG